MISSSLTTDIGLFKNLGVPDWQQFNFDCCLLTGCKGGTWNGWRQCRFFHFIFNARSSYASAVFGVVILSVHPSVCLVTSVLCDKIKQCTADILIPHKRAITLVFWHQKWLVGDAPSVWNLHSQWPTLFETRRLRQVSAYNVSTTRDGEKSSILTNRKSTTGFPTSYRWCGSKGDFKNIFE